MNDKKYFLYITNRNSVVSINFANVKDCCLKAVEYITKLSEYKLSISTYLVGNYTSEIDLLTLVSYSPSTSERLNHIKRIIVVSELAL